jgi:REP element-mobilizing transposase RayT
MPHSLARNLVHCVFSTKGRLNLIQQPDILWERLGTIAKSKGISLVTAGGTANHVHLLIGLSPKMALSNVIQNLKAHSSRWMKEDVGAFAWQEGFGGFSVSESNRDAVLRYIATQVQHHQKWTYEQEFKTLVRKSGLEYDPDTCSDDVPEALDTQNVDRNPAFRFAPCWAIMHALRAYAARLKPCPSTTTQSTYSGPRL